MPRKTLYIMLFAVAVVVGLTLAMVTWYPQPKPVAAVQDHDTNPKPIYEHDDKRLTATMDLTYCWFATFTNETTGKSHTLKNAYDKDGKPCH